MAINMSRVLRITPNSTFPKVDKMLRRISQHPSGKEESHGGRPVLGFGHLPLNHLTLDTVEKGARQALDTTQRSKALSANYPARAAKHKPQGQDSAS